ASLVTEGAFLANGGPTFFVPGTIDNIGGMVAFTADTLFGPSAGVSGDGTLTVLDFTAIGTGTSSIALSDVILLDSVGNSIGVTIVNGRVAVTPEPGSIALIAVGGLLLSGGLYLRRTAEGRGCLARLDTVAVLEPDRVAVARRSWAS